ncbi:TetR/AcrR family transcriptional regulator [Tsukamurella sp. 8F]|uniref:TetR/AcrR family transcriptional regulator n=1 Tax=unclassified Tsukamurella TaxID=2633480 RepID=UPI0023B99104|nr:MULTISPECIES: TetR/AcrR family transcriptional regulator [unclassified Tsukamurella]MDF0531649.1 TetR/AcrR family transcriptional regulator [Tsukamurella sp. 8J]MDF0588783.1 TetR/AcrR family transcriptional regulator [Tsukamurella sp. 8F]
MATPTATTATERKAELRESIVSAAFDEFAHRGYHNTSIADIARRLGIGHGTFYRYFENKRDILDHVVSDTVEKITEVLTEQETPDEATTLAEYRQQSDRIARALQEIFLADHRLIRILLFESTGIDRELTERLTGLLDTAATLTREYLENGVERRFLRPDLDTQNTARAINGMILAGALHGLSSPEIVDTFPAAVSTLVFGSIAAGSEDG